MALRALSLCSGVGGLDLGLAEWCGTVCFVERDAFAAAVLVARMEEAALDPAPVWDDLRSFDGRAWRGAVDLVVGGYPCQPFSAAGKRRGTEDERHLWPEVRRILSECAPPLAFFENVRGHLSLGFADVLADLAGLGFAAEWGLLAAADVGAPHQRERLFVLAYRDSEGRRLLRSVGLLDGERKALGNDADGRDSELAHSGLRRRIEPQRIGDEAKPAARAAGEPMGDADLARENAHAERGGSRRAACESGEHVGDTCRSGLDRRLRAAGQTRFPSDFPPGPRDADGWRRWLAEGGPQPVLRRGADGTAAFVDRADRLRCLGNAVVPAQAEAAFAILAERAMRSSA